MRKRGQYLLFRAVPGVPGAYKTVHNDHIDEIPDIFVTILKLDAPHVCK